MVAFWLFGLHLTILEITPGVAWGPLWDARNSIWVDHMQGKCPTAMLLLQPLHIFSSVLSGGGTSFVSVYTYLTAA